MLKRGPYKGVEVPYIINDVYINEHDDGYFLISRTRMVLGKLDLIKKIRVTFDTWNLYKPNTESCVDISGLFASCVYRKIMYNCSMLLIISVSVTTPNELLTDEVSHIGKIRGIYSNMDGEDMFLVSYSRTEYDIVPEDHIEILFKDCDNENNCRKHKVRAPKVIKRKLPRKSHKKVIDDDDLKVKKRKMEKRLMKE